MALGTPDRNAAPLMLLVGPEEKVRTGYLMASLPLKQGNEPMSSVDQGERMSMI